MCQCSDRTVLLLDFKETKEVCFIYFLILDQYCSPGINFRIKFL